MSILVMVKINYYIDTENVAYGCVDILLQAKEQDRILLFFSETSLQYGQLLEYCQRSKAYIEHMTIRQSGSSAMDMLIMAMVVEESNRFRGKKHIIVSNDNGYDSAIQILNERGYEIERLPVKQLSKREILLVMPKSNEPKHKKPVVDARLRKEYQKNIEEWNVLLTLPPKKRKIVIKSLDATEDRYDFYYKLIEYMGKEEGPKLYQVVKSHLYEIGR